MTKRMLIDALHPEETRVVIADENQVYDFDFVSASKKQLKGNIYLAKITRVEPSLQAAFVEYGGGKQGFLPFSEIHSDYYQIPVSDRRRLMEEAQAEEAHADTEEPAGEKAAASEAVESISSESIPAPEEATFPLADDALAPAPAIPTENAPQELTNDHPAYLMQGAIETSLSESADAAEDNIPIAEALAADAQLAHAAGDTIESAPAAGSAEDGQPEGRPAAEGPAAEGVETISGEEEEYQARPKKNVFFKRYKIQEVIRRGQIVLVQVIKEERGNKGCSLTTYLSLAGRYCVLMPNSPKDGGISRKIASADDRRRLKSISTELRLATGMSVIIRTAGMDRTRAEIKRDYDYLVKLWNQIREDTLKSNAPTLIYEESDIIKRAIRDQYSSDIDEVVVEGDDAYQNAKDFVKLLLPPSHIPKIKHYKEATPLFYAYNIEEQLLSMHDPVVKLRSGGYLVINPTEALISIDVNSGRATGERNIEETALRTNLEAAQEVARQLRLRDLAGLIVIDFIDMMESRNRRSIEKTLKDSLKADRAKIQIGRISPFGLLEMSRQRLRPSISESNMVQCHHCSGRGVIRSNESMSIQVIRSLEKEASSGTWGALRLIAPQDMALHLLNTKRDALRTIEERHNVSIQVLIDNDIASSEFNLEKMRRSQGGEERDRRRGRDRDRDRDRHERYERPRPSPVEAASAQEETANDNAEAINEASAEASEQPRENTYGERDRKGRRRRRRGRDRDRDRDRGDRGPRPDFAAGDAETPLPEAQENIPEDAYASQDAAPEGQAAEGGAPREGRPPRNRGGRGRRRWRDRDNRGPKQDSFPSDNQPAPPSEHASYADGNTLPAFATQEPVMPEPERPAHSFEPVIVAQNEPAHSDANAAPKKGWWQKMIELDD